jgi:hypothetical protein
MHLLLAFQKQMFVFRKYSFDHARYCVAMTNMVDTGAGKPWGNGANGGVMDF